jgi:hypothetical protein
MDGFVREKGHERTQDDGQWLHPYKLQKQCSEREKKKDDITGIT